MNTNTALFSVWVFFTIVMMIVSFVSLLSYQSLLDRLRQLDMKNWQEGMYVPMTKIIQHNLIWMLLVACIVAEVSSFAFEPVRNWFRSSFWIAFFVYVLPILILVIVWIVQKIIAKSKESPSPPPTEDE